MSSSSPLGSSWAGPLLRIAGRFFGVIAAIDIVLLVATAVATAVDATSRLWDPVATGGGPDGVFARLAAVAAISVVHLVFTMALVGVSGALLGTARLVDCAERADGWLRAIARNTSVGAPIPEVPAHLLPQPVASDPSSVPGFTPASPFAGPAHFAPPPPPPEGAPHWG